MKLARLAFDAAREAFERGDDRALIAFVRDNALPDHEARAYVADVLAGIRRRGDQRTVAAEGERLARAYSQLAFIRPDLPSSRIYKLIAPTAPDAAKAALGRYWRVHGRKAATPTASLTLEREAWAAALKQR